MSGAAFVPVAVSGAHGRVGREIVAALGAAPDFECVAQIDVGDDLAGALVNFGARVLIDFTTPAAGLANALTAIEAGVAPIIGTTGLSAADIGRIREGCERTRIGGCVAPEFALGAVLLMWLSELCAPHFEHAEVIEAHNPAKADAPSATALRTAERMVAARRGRAFAGSDAQATSLAGARGGTLGGVSVHSLRLAGVVADQQVVFGAAGQTLTLSHRTTSRAAFAPGVLAAARRVLETRRFYDSLEAVLGLPDPAPVGAPATS